MKLSLALPVMRGLSTARRREAIGGYLWISPWLIGFLAFTIGPMLTSLYLSLCDYRVVSAVKFIGFQNYRYAFTIDDLFWLSLRRTLAWVVFTLPLGIMGSLLAAMLLNQRLKGTALYRTLLFLPSLTPLVAAAILWRWILHPDVGVLNYLLSKVGIRGPGWMASVEWAMPAMALIALWTGVGGNRMIIFLAGLQGIPEELYEAAEIDGANIFQKAIRITLPLLSPTMFFSLVLGIIGSFQVFGMAFVTTQGGPANATMFYALNLYYQAFVNFDMGYASMLAWIMLVIVLFLTVIQLVLSNRWVYYEGEVRR